MLRRKILSIDAFSRNTGPRSPNADTWASQVPQLDRLLSKNFPREHGERDTTTFRFRPESFQYLSFG